MRTCRVLGYAAVLFGLLSPALARANQPRDWMLGIGKPGTVVNLDIIFGAVQAGVEHRIPVYGNANRLTLRASAIAAIPFGGMQLDADLRVVIATVGGSVGVTDVWRNQTFASDQSLTRKERRFREAAGEFDQNVYAWVEPRVQLAVPFNDYVVLNSVTTFRYTGARSRSFDNLIGVVHDGNYLRSDFQLFFKHKAIGAFAPMAQMLNFPLAGERHTQLNYGFAFVSRAGFVRRNDVLLFTLLYHPGEGLGGYDNKSVYGFATIRGPVSFTLAYRSVIDL